MTSEHSPAYNAALKKLYDAGRADIYMVSLDSDRYAWREAARNLPWTNVFDPQGMGGATLHRRIRPLFISGHRL